MKVLYVSHHRQRSGSGEAARNYIRSLRAVGVAVAARPILLQNDLTDIPEDIRACEETSLQDCDVCIQHVLPHFMDYNGRFKKNIGILITETIGWENSGWDKYIKLMDEIWTPNHIAALNTKITGIKVVPHACDVSRYNNVQPMSIPELEGAYTFYYIGEHNRRKRLSAFVEAFHLEFASNEPVNIVLKVYKPNQPGHEVFKEVSDLCNQIKGGLKLYDDLSRYHNELILANYMTDTEILSLHQACDCFVLSSYGEAWSYPAFDAMALGKDVIAPDTGGPRDFLNGYHDRFMVSGEHVPCIGSLETFQNLNTGRETWYSASIDELRFGMRKMYAQRKLRSKPTRHLDFSFEKIGKEMLECINEV